MAKRGDELEHPVTGERLVWRQVARDTNGERVEGDLFARPGGHPAAAHIHPNQVERFGVLDGIITLRVGSEESELPGLVPGVLRGAAPATDQVHVCVVDPVHRLGHIDYAAGTH